MKEDREEHCGVASEEVAVEEKKRNEGGEKGKRKRKRRGKEIAEGWTKEQELALQRAFFSAKPSPNFWKNVSKLVFALSLFFFFFFVIRIVFCFFTYDLLFA